MHSRFQNLPRWSNNSHISTHPAAAGKTLSSGSETGHGGSQVWQGRPLTAGITVTSRWNWWRDQTSFYMLNILQWTSTDTPGVFWPSCPAPLTHLTGGSYLTCMRWCHVSRLKRLDWKISWRKCNRKIISRHVHINSQSEQLMVNQSMCVIICSLCHVFILNLYDKCKSTQEHYNLQKKEKIWWSSYNISNHNIFCPHNETCLLMALLAFRSSLLSLNLNFYSSQTGRRCVCSVVINPCEHGRDRDVMELETQLILHCCLPVWSTLKQTLSRLFIVKPLKPWGGTPGGSLSPPALIITECFHALVICCSAVHLCPGEFAQFSQQPRATNVVQKQFEENKWAAVCSSAPPSEESLKTL